MKENRDRLDALFVHVPRWRGERREIMVAPLGLPALANLLAGEGWRVELLHLGIESEVTAGAGGRFSLRRTLEERRPRLVLLSLHWNQQVRPVIELAQRVRSWAPEARLVLGGLTASVFARQAVESLPFIDAVVRGDAEVPLRELARVWLGGEGSLEEVPNLTWRDEEGEVRESSSVWVLDEATAGGLRHGDLSLMAHHREYLERALYADFSPGSPEARGYASAAYLNAGRGCGKGCLCCGGSGASQWVTSRRRGILLYPLDKLVADVRDAVEQGARVLRTSFDPPGSLEHQIAWFEAIRAEGWRLSLIYDLWTLPDRRLLQAIRACFEPGSMVIFSPECGSEAVRSRVRPPGFTNDELLGAVRQAESLALRTHCFLTAGLPTESPAEVDETARLIERLRRETETGLSVTPMYLDPASPIWLEPERYGVKLIRRTLADFYDERGLPGGPGYTTGHFDEAEILAACDHLLAAAGQGPGSEPPLRPPGEGHQGGAGRRSRALLAGVFRSVTPEGLDSPLGSQGGFVDTLAPSPYSLANGYLKAFAEADAEVRRTWSIDLLDLAEPLYLEDEREEVRLGPSDLDDILAFEPDLVAFSTYCWNIDAVRWAAAELRRRRPGLILLIGGRGTEGEVAELLAETPALDGAITGEGELAFREVLRRGGRDLGEVPGVVARRGGEIVSGGPAGRVRELDSIPSPYLSGALRPPHNGVMLELSRGCLHRCGYCTWNADKELRFFSGSRVEAEVRWAAERGHRLITLNDSAVNSRTDRLRDQVEAIGRADPEGRVRFTYNVRHDELNEEQLALLERLPTHMVLLGVETLNPGAMVEVDRAPVEPAGLRERLIGLARATRPPVVSIVLGLPGDDLEGFGRTLEALLAWTRPDRPGEPAAVGTVLVSLLQVYRGSRLWRRRDELGLRFHEPGIPYLIESPSWPREDLARAKRALVRLMGERPDQVKAAEAIVLMEGQGQTDPWLTRRRVAALLAEWPLGASRQGWTLERMGTLRDTGRGFSLRFRWRAGGEARLVLRRRQPGDRGEGSRLFLISPEELPGCSAPEAALRSLRARVRDLLGRGEERLAREAARRRGR